MHAEAGFGKLHGVQREALLRVLKEMIYRDRVRGIVQLPTGSGKTILAAMIIAILEAYYRKLGYEEGITSLFLTPRIVIRRQVFETFRKIIKSATKGVGIIEIRSSRDFCAKLSGGHPLVRATLVYIVTPQLLLRVYRGRKKCWGSLRERVHAVIIDEAHTYYVGKEASKAVEDLVKSDVPIVLGLTATPIRDSISLIGDLLYYKHSSELMDGNVLAKGLVLKVYRTRLGEFRPIHEFGREKLDDPWLYAIRERASRYAEMVVEILNNFRESYLGRTRYPKALVVAPNSREADMLYEELCNRLLAGVNRGSSSVGGRLVFVAHYGVNDAHEQIREFKRVSEGVLVAVNMVDIGFDDPNLEVMILARPIRSPIAYAQLRGRVLRRPRPAEMGNTTNLKAVYGAFIVDLVGEEDKRVLEERVPLVERGYYGKDEFGLAIVELKGVERGMIREAEARVYTEYAYELRIGQGEERPTLEEPRRPPESRADAITMVPVLVACVKDLLEKGVFEIICPEKSGTRVRFKVVSRPTYIRGEPEERVVIEIGNCEKDEIKMSELLEKDGTIDNRKLMKWILKALRTQGLIRCHQHMLRQRVLYL